MTSPLTTTPKTKAPFLVALGLAAGPVVALGFTRFAYALLLPAMRDQLGWSYAGAGAMNTANALGYIIGAATAAWWARRLGARAAFGWSMVISALALLASGVTGEIAALGIFRFVGGLSTAVTFVLGSALASRAHAVPVSDPLSRCAGRSCGIWGSRRPPSERASAPPEWIRPPQPSDPDGPYSNATAANSDSGERSGSPGRAGRSPR
jgi:MFS family permease